MNKTELVDLIAGKTGFTKVDSKKMLEAFMESVSETLAKGEDISLVGFGSFRVQERNERNGRNPHTGKPMKIAAKKVVRFRAGAELTTKCN